MKCAISKIICSCILLLLFFSAQSFSQDLAQTDDLFLGIKLSPGVRAIAAEIETKTKKEIYAEFVDQTETRLGSSYLTERGTAIVQINSNLADNPKKLEAVIAHELLHLRLRVRSYPVFLFSPSIKTAKGPAQDVEQPNANDLTSFIEHHIFKAEMEKLGLAALIDLAGATVENAHRDTGEDGQADSLNYARALLEYRNSQDVEEVRKAYERNGWKRALLEGKALADIINRSNIQTPQEAETVFLRCLTTLYSSSQAPIVFRLTLDPSVKAYRRMIINAARPKRQR